MEAGVVAAAGAARSATRVRPEREALARRVDRRMTVAMMGAHAVGALDVALLLFWALPVPAGVDAGAVLAENLVAFAALAPVAFALCFVLGRRQGARSQRWLLEGRPPSSGERDRALRLPLLCTRTDAMLWAAGVAVFFGVNVGGSLELALHVATTVALGGITTCAIAYLLAERILRPVTALALAEEPPTQPAGLGVKARLIVAWAAATAVPFAGLLLVGLHGLEQDATATAMSRAVITLGLMGVTVGLVATVLVAKSVAEPITAVRRALGRVEGGDLGAEVPVNDGSEVGLLQSGFNRMAHGLRERERLRDLYGRQVGEDVARAALDAEPALGGEERFVAALFVDVVGSTALAAEAPPQRVVHLLNRFFHVVVETVGEHGGWVNKFDGDGALCVFGAPAAQLDPAGCALAAARDLAARLRRELPDLEVAVGVSAGRAVAGWVGAERRFEYTVIGDPVNEAARLCELAKTRPERLLASEAILARAQAAGERARWRLGEPTVLRGRRHETRLAVPG
jgi:adenylate cyclase